MVDQLCQYAQMLAWLDLIPEKDSEVTNAQRYPDIELPELPAGFAYLAGFLVSIGKVSQTSAGLVRVAWSEIDTWAKGCGVYLNSFEFRALGEMSRAYANIANDKKAECPTELPEESREIIEQANISSWMAAAKKA